MSGKGAKGLIMGKNAALNKDKDKDKKKPTSRSSRAGLQVRVSVCNLCDFGCNVMFYVFISTFVRNCFLICRF